MERINTMLFSPGKEGGLKLNIRPAVFTAFAVALLSFPAMNPVYANGIDPPLSWVFNYLIQGHFSLGKDIIFPHGPLAFIMYPLPVGLNLVTAIIISLLIRAAFAFALIRLPNVKGIRMTVVAAVSAFVLLAFPDILLVVVGLVILSYLNYAHSRKVEWAFAALLLTVAAIYVKAFVGIVCSLITASYFLLLCYDVLKKEEKWQRLLLILLPPILLILGWIVIYGTIHGLPRYLYGMFQLAGDNSSAVAYYPDNNWILLCVAFALLAGILFIQRKQVRALRFFFLVAPALFAVWKYGMAREDYLHAGLMFMFVMMLAVLLVFVIEKYRIISAGAGFAVALLVFVNLQNAYYYEPIKFSTSGFRNFAGLLMNYQFVNDTCEAASHKNISRNILDQEIRARIGKASVDIYPWDYSFIPANDLNWKPRPVLQSYACYTPWLDRENSRHFSSPAAPQFLIWELRKITHDIHNGTLESIDGRYLLNDQPETILSILANYCLADRQEGTFPVLVFEKRKVPLPISRKVLPHPDVSWDQWIDVNAAKTDILRAKVNIQRNLSGRITSFLYKDEAVFVYYLLNNGEIRIYRIVPRNAEEGLWINPLVMNPENKFTEPTVKKIMFRCTNHDRMKSNIQLKWEQLILHDSGVKNTDSGLAFKVANAQFGKVHSPADTNLFYSLTNLESVVKGWSVNPLPEVTIKACSGSTSCKVMPGGFSMSFERSLDSILTFDTMKSYIIKTMAWVNADRKIDASYVISIENNGKSLEWKSVKINDFIIEKNKWNYVYNYIVLKPELISQKGLKLKVYAWNNGKVPFLIDDLQVRVDSWGGN